MKKFGLIAEGPTDQAILSNILCGFFENPDIVPRKFLPPLDETDKNRSECFSNWELVLNYCRTGEIKEALQVVDYVIIQIDTDTCNHPNFNIDKTVADTHFEDFIELVYQKLREAIGEEFYNKYSDRLIFAVSVHEMECWLLPIFCSGKTKQKIKGCLAKLTYELRKQGVRYNGKNYDCYDKISSKFFKRKDLLACYEDNPSLKIFIEELEKRNIQID